MEALEFTYSTTGKALEVNPIFFGKPLEKNDPEPFFCLKAYTYGFNGMEKDDELKGSGNSYTSEWRQYDPRLGRWISPDPVVHPFQSPYNGFDNNPIFFIDPWGSNVDGYTDGEGNYKWFDDEDSENFTDDNGTSWDKVSDDKEKFTEGVKQIEAVRGALVESGFSESEVKMDVQYQTDSELEGKYAVLNNADKYTSNWEQGQYDSRNNTSDASESSPLYLTYNNFNPMKEETSGFSMTGYSLKFYPSRSMSIGLVRSSDVGHFLEAGFEYLDGKVFEFTGFDDVVSDMHGRNADTFLKYRSLSKSRPSLFQIYK